MPKDKTEDSEHLVDELKGVLKRRNSIGKGLSSVTFEMDTLSKKSSTQDKLLLNLNTTINALQSKITSLENQIIVHKSRIDILEKALADLIDG
jgi:peptidoglycan hydrolase CwlO-like protein